MNIIGTETDNTHPYMAGLLGKEVGIHAPSLYAAKQLAVEYFKPTKKTAGYLWVESTTDGQMETKL